LINHSVLIFLAKQSKMSLKITHYVGNNLIVETRPESLAKKFLKCTTSIMFALQNATILCHVNVSVPHTTDQTKKTIQRNKKQYNRNRTERNRIEYVIVQSSCTPANTFCLCSKNRASSSCSTPSVFVTPSRHECFIFKSYD